MSKSVYQKFRVIRRDEKHSINKITYFYRLHSVITQQEIRNVSIDIIAILRVFLIFYKNYKGNEQGFKIF